MPIVRWPRYSLRTLLAAVTVFCLILGHHFEQQRREQRALDMIARHGGEAHRRWQVDSRYRVQKSAVEPKHGFLSPRSWFGDSALDVVNVRINRSLAVREGTALAFTDKELALFANLTHLERLVLVEVPVTDAAIVNWSGLRNLAWLEMMNPSITDEGLRAIGRFDKLHTLSLIGSREKPRNRVRITDDGLRHLTGLRRLNVLLLGWTRIGDRGMAHISHFPGLWMLHLDETFVSDVGLAEVAKIPNLTWLSLNGTRVSDDGIALLADRDELNVLSAANTAVTARGAAILKAVQQGTIQLTPNLRQDLAQLHATNVSLGSDEPLPESCEEIGNVEAP